MKATYLPETKEVKLGFGIDPQYPYGEHWSRKRADTERDMAGIALRRRMEEIHDRLDIDETEGNYRIADRAWVRVHPKSKNTTLSLEETEVLRESLVRFNSSNTTAVLDIARSDRILEYRELAAGMASEIQELQVGARA